MSARKRKNHGREFGLEAVRLIAEKGYSIAEAFCNLGVEYSVLRRWKKQLADDQGNEMMNTIVSMPSGGTYKQDATQKK